MAKNLDRVLSWAQRTPWAILPSQASVIAGIFARRHLGVKLTRKKIRDIVGDRRAEVSAHQTRAAELSAGSGGLVAVIPIVGTIAHRSVGMDDMSGIAATQKIVKQVQEAQASSQVRAIVLDIDSPGGAVDGVAEAAEALRAGSKPVVAVANTMAASAAYWLGSQADEFVVSKSAEVGSIGVFTMHTDISEALEQEGVKVTVSRAGKHKAEGLPFEPLTPEARAEMDATVGEFYDLFVKDVAQGRGVTTRAVRGGFGEGRLVRAKQAVSLGMADRIATLEQTVERLARRAAG